MDDTPLTYVDTLEGLEQLRDDLKKVREFAVDLEHHSYRSFQGFTCLMQVSTRSHDYIVDTLAVRHHMHLLLDPFTDPSIVKVMHGADFDVEWLQKDFGVYLVNLFDTGQASRVLQLPKFSLAFLLQYCCQVQADKQYQLADWRIRPLPQEMLNYARDDTHYLLYIYDRMRNELIRRGDKSNHLLHLVLTKSRDICLKQYRKPIFSENAYLELYYKHRRKFNSRQLLCLKLLYAWRDHVARDEDESPGYVLPNHMLFQIAEILPREMGGVLACCNPIPILLRQQQHEVFLLVQQARDSPLTDKLPTIEQKKSEPVDVAETSVMEVDGGDLSKTTPTPVTNITIKGPPVKVVKAALSMFGGPGSTSRLDARVASIKSRMSKFLEQYMEVKRMSPSEVLVQQQLAYEALASSRLRSSQAQASPATEPHPPVLNKDTTTRVTQKRPLSVREMEYGEAATPERPVKQKCLSQSSSDFTPFQYQDSQYTDYTPQGSSKDSFDPHITPRGRGSKRRGHDFPAAPRSRVQQKSGQKSQTFRRKN